MIEAQGGNPEWVFNPSLFPSAPLKKEVISHESGYISNVNAEGYGTAALLLGAGRTKKDDKIDYYAGIYLNKIQGEYIGKGETLCTLYTSDESLFAPAEEKIIESTIFSDNEPEKNNIILNKID